jgi:hypothetical protein
VNALTVWMNMGIFIWKMVNVRRYVGKEERYPVEFNVMMGIHSTVMGVTTIAKSKRISNVKKILC